LRLTRKRLDLPAPLALAVIALSAAALLADVNWLEAPGADSPLCRLYLCSNASLLDRANISAAEPGKAAAESAIADFREALRRDVSYPYRWSDLGDALSRAGRADEARFCYQRALYLAPNSPFILIRAANFEFGHDRPAAALPLTARILDLTADFDGPVFLAYARAGLAPSTVLRDGLPSGPRAATAYFDSLLARDISSGDAEVWRFLRSKNYAGDDVAVRYVLFLIRTQRYDDALEAWAGHLGARGGDFPGSNRIFNGGFEDESTGAPLDWSPGETASVKEQRDDSTAHSGRHSLKIVFDGESNVRYRGASQVAIVSPGTWRFSAYIKTQGLTTNEGLAFQLECPGRFEVTTASVNGTAGWTRVAETVTIPPGARQLRIRLARRPSEKFDNKIAGAAWVDDVQLSR
jgi:hypothetical protein